MKIPGFGQDFDIQLLVLIGMVAICPQTVLASMLIQLHSNINSDIFS
jgi:hypothetical protein